MLRSYSRGLLERAQHQYHSCCTKRWFQAIPVIDVEPLVNQQQVPCLLMRFLATLTKLQAQFPMQNAAEVAQQLHKACNEVGFFYVSLQFLHMVLSLGCEPSTENIRLIVVINLMQVANHGVQTCQKVLKEAHAWFALPVST